MTQLATARAAALPATLRSAAARPRRACVTISAVHSLTSAGQVGRPAKPAAARPACCPRPRLSHCVATLCPYPAPCCSARIMFWFADRMEAAGQGQVAGVAEVRGGGALLDSTCRVVHSQASCPHAWSLTPPWPPAAAARAWMERRQHAAQPARPRRRRQGRRPPAAPAARAVRPDGLGSSCQTAASCFGTCPRAAATCTSSPTAPCCSIFDTVLARLLRPPASFFLSAAAGCHGPSPSLQMQAPRVAAAGAYVPTP